MQQYSPEIEQRMQQFYQSLSEKDRRRYAAVEALKLASDFSRHLCKEDLVSE